MYSVNERVRFLIKQLGKSQDSFGKGIHRSRSEISNIVYDKVVVKDDIITAICDSYGVDRIWLETGAGDPFRPLDKDEQIAAVLGQAIAGPSTARDRLIRALARLPEDAFPLIEQFILDAAASIANEKKE